MFLLKPSSELLVDLSNLKEIKSVDILDSWVSEFELGIKVQLITCDNNKPYNIGKTLTFTVEDVKPRYWYRAEVNVNLIGLADMLRALAQETTPEEGICTRCGSDLDEDHTFCMNKHCLNNPCCGGPV